MEMLFLSEAARELRLSRPWVRQLADAGILRCERIGERGVRTFAAADVARLAAERKKNPPKRGRRGKTTAGAAR